MELNKNKNCWTIPTDKPSRLFLKETTLLLNNQYTLQKVFPKGKCQNLYITSDSEKIKMDDWYLTDDKRVEKCAPDWRAREWHKKIILTTDQDLIKGGVQAIDDTFLEWFVKNPSCEWVDVMTDTFTVKEMSMLPVGTRNLKYKIIIPQEEPKQETIEEVLTYTEAAKKEERIFNSKIMSNQETLGDFINRESKSYIESVGIVKGAKWQQERMYSEEDMEKCWDACKRFDRPISEGDAPNFNEFIEQFKKK